LTGASPAERTAHAVPVDVEANALWARQSNQQSAQQICGGSAAKKGLTGVVGTSNLERFP